MPRRTCIRRPLDGAWFEPDVAAGLQRHDGSNRKRSGYPRKKAAQPFVVPDPAALKVRELNLPLPGPFQKIVQRFLVTELSSLNITLEAGQIVTTGTCVTPIAVSPGDVVTGDYGILGTI